MIADDIKEQAGIKLLPDSWYVGALEQALIERQQRSGQIYDQEGVRQGDLFFFSYNVGAPQYLSFWDVQPLAVIVGFFEDGFLGCNLHYINPDYRDVIANNLLNSRGESPIPKNSIHRYKYSGIRSMFKVPRDEDWAAISLLPTEQFVDQRGMRYPKYKAFNARHQRRKRK